ncbi:hypothetical protein ATY37_12070 [Vibrio cidicii]|uniref:RND efflux pump membrane fusion protein barrel-sandwich domain-containing protein n=1 Tax=Vibrio cidicii TaxID=1763883 RepID=A0A151L029_9VIBR|nr:efflux RND transporter periplasmic adaptor subunit [Vibrio cidicii]KYN26318.1 hypothetical protein AUQ44_14670 [Vibrio cidicii]KYN89701.1 hypothetical protein ATY37_12070 [Vibrio cidicii]
MKKVLVLLAGASSIIAALVALEALEPQPVAFKEKPQPLPTTTVMEVVPTDYAPRLILLATTTARWPIELKATSSAQLTWLHPKAEPGMRVEKGTELAKLDTHALAADLAEANSQFKQAQLNLQQVEHEQTVALKMLSATPSSAFARREPQVAAAKALLAQTKQRVTSAMERLSQASMIAPFDAVILKRSVSPNQWLEAGQTAFSLAASDSLDVTVLVSERHWQQLQAELSSAHVKVQDRAGQTWPAYLRYVLPEVDALTRQRQVVFAVTEPYQGSANLRPNQPVNVIVQLAKQADITALPLSAITRDGDVWTLDEQQRLQKERVTLVSQTPEHVYVRFVENSNKTRRVVLYPLLSMLEGQQVLPQSHTAYVLHEEAMR